MFKLYPPRLRNPALVIALAAASVPAASASAQWRDGDHGSWRDHGWHDRDHDRDHRWQGGGDWRRRGYGWGPGAVVGGALLGIGIGAAIGGAYPPTYYAPPPAYYPPPPPVYYAPPQVQYY